MEWIIVSAVLVAAVGYAAWRIYDAFRRTKDPCYGCDGCQLKDLKRRNNVDCKKK